MQQFGRYEVIDNLGRGAMGIVYRCRDPQIGRIVAVKTMLLDDVLPAERGEFKRRMLTEAQAAGVLSHPNIVTIFDVGEQGETVYIVMEYLEGTALSDEIGAQGALQSRRVLAIAEQVGSALDYAHSKGIIHRDVKPANIMQVQDGRAVLMDFGIARMFEPNIAEKGALIGSPIYMSPEQIDGETLTGTADAYSLATVIFEMLTGRRPFTGETFHDIVQAKYHNQRMTLSSINPALPVALEAFFDVALAADPGRRYPSCADLVQGLRGALYTAAAGSAFLTSTANPFTSTFRQPAGPPKPPAVPVINDPHMAETHVFTQRFAVTPPPQAPKKLTDTHDERPGAAPAGPPVPPVPPVPPPQQMVTIPPPVAHAPAAPPYVPPPVSTPDAIADEPEFRIRLPKLDSGSEAKNQAAEDARKAIAQQDHFITFRKPEDTTVDGQKKLVEELKSAIAQMESAGENCSLLTRIGILFMRLGKNQEAMAYYKRVMKLDFENIDAYIATAHLYDELVMTEKAKDYWAISKWLTERKTGRLQAADGFALGRKLEKAGLIKGAILVWEETAALYPWHLDTWRELSRYYLQMKDYRKAIQALEAIVSLSKYDAQSFRNLAVCYQNTREYPQALDNWEKALRLESGGEGAARARKQIEALRKIIVAGRGGR